VEFHRADNHQIVLFKFVLFAFDKVRNFALLEKDEFVGIVRMFQKGFRRSGRIFVVFVVVYEVFVGYVHLSTQNKYN